MASPPDTRVLVLAPTADEDAIAAFLADRFAVAGDAPRTLDRTAYDTADRRLRDKGLELALERARGGARLVLAEPGLPDLEETAPARPRYLAADLPEALRARLAGLVDVRALLPVARLRTRVRALRVLDAEEKTVVRIRLERAELVRRAGGPLALAPRVHLQPVRGYRKPLERVLAALTQDLHLHAEEVALLDQAAAELGLDPAGLQTKIAVPLRPADRADHAAIAVCLALAGVAQANVPGVLEDLDPEFLHDLRVSVRRTRSVLRELKRVFPPSELEHFRTELKWVQSVTGPVRDLDVQLEEWPQLAGGLPPTHRDALDEVHALLARRRAAALRRLRRDLRGRRFEQVWLQWSELLASDLGSEEDRPDATEPIAALAGRRIRRVYRRMVGMGEAIDDASPSEDLHDLRKRGKELRYLLELFGQFWPKNVVKPMVSTLKGLQDVLGRHEDRHAQVEQLRALAPGLAECDGGARAVLALGVLTERLERDQGEARGEFAERFAAFSASKQRKLVKRTFRENGS